jgi:hypothetical protein
MTAQPLAPVISAVPAGRQRARSAAGRVRGREGEGGLADAARPRQRDQADVSLPQQPGDCRQLFHPVDQRPARRRQRRPAAPRAG